MSKLVFHQRVAPLWIMLIVDCGYLWFAWYLYRTWSGPPSDDQMGLRVFIPFFALCGYLFAILTFNWRRGVITPAGVRVTSVPLPGFVSTSISREDIRHCYCRRGVTRTRTGAVEVTFMAGVEAARGFLLDVAGPLPSLEHAQQAARKMAAVLNESSDLSSLDVRSGPSALPRDNRYLRKLLLWFVLAMAAIIGGAIWEVRATRWERPVLPEMAPPPR